MAGGRSQPGSLEGRVAVVTGGGTGIGRAIARRFAAEGCSVLVAGRRLDPVEAVASEIGGIAVQADVSAESDVARLFELCETAHGRLDVLVNNAGVTGPIVSAADMEIADWDRTMEVNVRGVILCVKHAIPAMTRVGGGSIINMSSGYGLRGYPMRSAYVATKFAVIGITQAVAYEVGQLGIRVNALCPGAVNGELMQGVLARRMKAEGRTREEIIRSYTDAAALRKWVEPEEVAEVALFLASDASKAITAEHVRVDAGRM